MTRINAQLEALLRDFERRSSNDLQSVVQLRAALEANELTLQTFNAAAEAGAIRSFAIDTEGRGADHVGRFDPEQGNLRQQKASRPRTVKTLSRTIGSFFQKQLAEGDIKAILAELAKAGHVAMDGAKVTYSL